MWIPKILVFCAIFAAAALALDVLAPEQLKGRVNSPIHRRVGSVASLPDLFIVHSVQWAPNVGANNINSTVVVGSTGENVTVTKIACLTSQYFASASNDRSVLTAFRSGLCDAVILIAEGSEIAGSDFVQRDAAVTSAELESITIPVVEIDRFVPRDVWSNAIRNGTVIVVRITKDDTNPHISVWTSPAWIIAHTALLFWCFANALLALKGLAAFLRQIGCHLVLPNVLLTLHVGSNVFRFAFLLLLFFMRTGDVTYFISNIILLLSYPFNLVCTMMIFLYWNELITRAKAVPILFLEKYRKGFTIFSGVLFGLCLFIALLASFYGIYCLVAMGVIIIIVSIGLSIASISVGLRVRAQILSSPPSTRRQRLLRATNLIIISSLCLVAFVIAGIAYVFPANSLVVNNIGFFYIWFWLNMNSFLQIVAFTPKGSTETSSTLSTSGTVSRIGHTSQEGSSSKINSSDNSI